MTKLSNVPMQPNPSAVERPMTLVERIQPILDDLMMECFKHGFHQKEMTEAEFIDYSRKNCVPPKREIIGILKQHQSWRKIPSDEKPQDMQAYNLLLKTDSTEYPTLYSVGLFRQYASGHVWLSLVEAETYIDESKILAWQPMNMPSAEFFESLKQPPREPQYLISKGGYWYRSDAKGYTASKHEAGRFSKEFAERHAKEVPEVRIFEDKENE